MWVPAVKITFTVLLSGPFFVEVCLYGFGSTLMEGSDVFSLVDCSAKCLNDTTEAVFVCQKLEWPPILEPGKVSSVKEKVSISFTSGFRLVNVYRYQIVL